MPRYVCAYRVRGKDHDGYCSGEDAKHYPPLDKYVIKTLQKDEYVESPRELEWTDRGCTSGESGYCRGFWQKYSLKYVLDVKDANWVDDVDDYESFIKDHIWRINSKIKDERDVEDSDDGDEDGNDDGDDNDGDKDE